jgi:O-acetyl-ADP-ribose deacetylase (regulator of RNase III)
VISYTSGDIFDSTCEALVNPVNCVGVMGAGLAKQFSKRFPANTEFYRIACDQGIVRTGEIFWTKQEELYIANFPTKDDWRNPSKLEYIETGLECLKHDAHGWNIKSIAMPKIGCGLGGLLWEDVLPLIQKTFETSKTKVVLYV